MVKMQPSLEKNLKKSILILRVKVEIIKILVWLFNMIVKMKIYKN